MVNTGRSMAKRKDDDLVQAILGAALKVLACRVRL